MIFASPEGTNDLEELQHLAKQLRDEDNNIEYARRVSEVARRLVTGKGLDVRYEVLRMLAICTYKTPDQPLERRLKSALQIVDELLQSFDNPVADDDKKRKQDLCGIKGAIYKVYWSATGLRDHLEMSLYWYRLGTELGIERDKGYNAINAAFVMEMLSTIGADAARKRALTEEAWHIRTEVCVRLRDTPDESLKPWDRFWFYATLGEAYLGLCDFDEAQKWMEKAGHNLPKPWQLESAARQNAQLARIKAAAMNIQPHDLTTSQPWAVIRALMGAQKTDQEREEAALSFTLGKVGLALSGGGFRASLFHIGVLARLAELDMLRHVEVISCVSGGSILGAFYYLELRKTLLEKSDDKLSQQDYIDIVRRIQEKFLTGVQKNIRLRMLMEFGSNLKVFSLRASSMTDRLAVLYDRELFDRVDDEFKPQRHVLFWKRKRRSISDILITLPGPRAGGHFDPKYDNWTRKHKIPVLILNATTLNTCHNWQFTGTFMGEPPTRSSENIDANDRLRRLYYGEAPTRYRDKSSSGQARSKVKLSEAVGASAAVPGLFDPLSLDELYGTKAGDSRKLDYGVGLVDGGAWDNQGVTSLLDQNCTVLLVSDASGQTGVALQPGSGRLDVMKRTNNILMARVRESQYGYLATLRDSNALRGLMYVHLKKNLDPEDVNWLRSADVSPRSPTKVLTNYGMRRDVQAKLANIRTDLDSFSDCEADALMLSGYLMTRHEFDECIKSFPVSKDASHPWRFLRLAAIASSPADHPDLDRLLRALDIAKEIAWKPFMASWIVKGITGLAASGLVFLLVSWCRSVWAQQFSFPEGKFIGYAVGISASLFGIRIALTKGLKYRNSYIQVLASMLLLPLGWILLRLHLWMVEPFYTKYGPRFDDKAASDEQDGDQGRIKAAAAGDLKS
jgi:predicted acylesterase/phospholipase RssA